MNVLRSALQPVTHELPDPLRNLGISLIGPACYQSLILDIDPSNADCLKLALSKGLGIGIVAASAIVKVPQILKLARSRSASGVSFLAYFLETCSLIITLAYNVRNGFPFSTFGEAASVAVQNVIIASLVLNYTGRQAMTGVFVAGLAVAGAALFSEKVVPQGALGYLQGGASVLGVASKVPQILAVWKEGGTGQLSAFAVFNYLLGSLTRIFTTLQEVGDKTILYGFIAGCIFNVTLAAQMAYYWNAPSSQSEGKQIEGQMAVDASSGYSTSSAPKAKTPTTRRRG